MLAQVTRAMLEPAGQQLPLPSGRGGGSLDLNIRPHIATTATVMRIADYRDENAREVVQLWRASFEHGVGITDHHPIQDQLDHFLADVVPHNKVRVACEGSLVIGFIAFTPESIAHLYVRVKWIGRGVGTCLLGLAKAESGGSLWLYTFARNKNARRFYERHGFREVERESENMWRLEAIKYRWVRGDSAA